MELYVNGLKELGKHLDKCTNLDAVKRVVQTNGDQLNRRMKKATKTAFKKGYSTGQTASSINTEISDGGLTATVAPHTDYASYVEYGTRYMEAEPFVRPSFTEQKEKFINDMKKVVK